MNDTDERSFWRHRMGKFGVFIVAIFTVWFGGWFLAANYVDGKIEDALAQLSDSGTLLECDGRDIKGFPFRMGLNCDEIRFGSVRTGPVGKTGALRTTSILYDPTEMISELDSPVLFSLTGPETILNWDNMRLYSNVTTDGALQRLSLTFDKLRANEGETDIRAQSGGFHARPTPAQSADLDLALNLKQFRAFAGGGGEIDPTDIVLDFRIKQGHEMLVQQRQALQDVLANGLDGEVRGLTFTVNGGGVLAARGPLSIDEFGYVSGDVELGVANPEALKIWAGTINRDVANGVGLIASAVAGTGQKAEIGGAEVDSIRVTIDKGTVRLGFIELGRIPPLDT